MNYLLCDMITFGFVTAEWLGDEVRGGILSIFSKVEDAETSKDAKPEADVARDVASPNCYSWLAATNVTAVLM